MNVMTDKNSKVVTINEEKLVDMIHNIVEATIAERNLVPAEPKTKKVRVTESQLKALKAKGVDIKKITKL